MRRSYWKKWESDGTREKKTENKFEYFIHTHTHIERNEVLRCVSFIYVRAEKKTSYNGSIHSFIRWFIQPPHSNSYTAFFCFFYFISFSIHLYRSRISHICSNNSYTYIYIRYTCECSIVKAICSHYSHASWHVWWISSNLWRRFKIKSTYILFS